MEENPKVYHYSWVVFHEKYLRQQIEQSVSSLNEVNKHIWNQRLGFVEGLGFS